MSLCVSKKWESVRQVEMVGGRHVQDQEDVENRCEAANFFKA